MTEGLKFGLQEGEEITIEFKGHVIVVTPNPFNPDTLELRTGSEEKGYDVAEIVTSLDDVIQYVQELENESVLSTVMTPSEAANRWHLSDGSVIRHAIRQGRIPQGEFKQSGSTWLVTEKGMIAAYGSESKINNA